MNRSSRFSIKRHAGLASARRRSSSTGGSSSSGSSSKATERVVVDTEGRTSMTHIREHPKDFPAMSRWVPMRRISKSESEEEDDDDDDNVVVNNDDDDNDTEDDAPPLLLSKHNPTVVIPVMASHIEMELTHQRLDATYDYSSLSLPHDQIKIQVSSSCATQLPFCNNHPLSARHNSKIPTNKNT